MSEVVESGMTAGGLLKEARQAAGMKTLPVDAVVIGIIDTVDVVSRKIYPAT